MNKAIPILLLTTAAPAIACLHLVRELREERAHSEALQAKVAELEKSAAEAQVFRVVRRASPFSAPVEMPPGTSIGARSTSPAKQSDAPTRADVSSAALASEDTRDQMREHFERQRALLRNPEYREAVRASTRLGMNQNYPGFTAELGLSEDEANRFMDLLTDQQLQSMEHDESLYLARAGDDEARMREAHERMQERMRQQQAEIEMHLGPTNYQKWQDYQQTLGQRHRLASMQSQLALAGTPLDAEQSGALLAALVQEQRKQQAQAGADTGQRVGSFWHSNGPAPGQEEWIKTQEQSNERLLAAIKSNLSSQQASKLEQMLDGELDLHRTQLKLLQAEGQNATRGFSSTGAWAPIYTEQAVVVAPPLGENEAK
jgi:hypothetical protein